MKFSYNWLNSFFDKNLPKPAKLADLITGHVFEVDEIQKKRGDWIIDIDILPNRADCFSHLGIAKELSAILNSKIKIPKIETNESSDKAQSMASIEIADGFDCPRYTARVISEVKVGPSPEWMKKRLGSCGLQSINNIVDTTNYVMLEMGQPLHAFDLDKVNNGKIVVRKAKKNEEITTLDNKKYLLSKNVLVVADKTKPLAIAGIKGGKGTEVDKSTRNIFLESANFNRKIVRKGSSFLRLRTDASLRFEHGLDPNLTESAANRAAELIEKHTSGKILKGLIDFYPLKTGPATVPLDIDYMARLLGINIPKSSAIKILKALGFDIAKEKERHLEIVVPTLRSDVSIQEDLIEEIGRIYGYEKIKSSIPVASIDPPRKNKDLYWGNKAKKLLKGAGFSEVYNYSFISESQKEIFGYDQEGLIEVESPISLEQKYLRPELVPHLIKNIGDNEKFFDEIKIFELGKIFGESEKESLSAAMTGESFFHVKGVIEMIFEQLGIDGLKFADFPEGPDFLHLKKRAKIISKTKMLGFMGDVSQKTLSDMKIGSKISIFVLDFEKIKKMATEDRIYRPIAKFPAISRDLSILVPEKENFQSILGAIKDLKERLIEKIELFDVYSGSEIPSGKKSFALRLIYRDDKKTLTANKINGIHDKVIKAIEEKKWSVRK